MRWTVPVPTPHSFDNRQHAPLGAQQTLNSLFELSRYARATKLFALFHGPLESRIDPLPDHAALELGERARNLKHETACDRLLIQVKIDATVLERLDSPKQVDQGSA
jgi:hypothetical protein